MVFKGKNRANTKLCYSEAGVSLEGRVLPASSEVLKTRELSKLVGEVLNSYWLILRSCVSTPNFSSLCENTVIYFGLGLKKVFLDSIIEAEYEGVGYAIKK